MVLIFHNSHGDAKLASFKKVHIVVGHEQLVCFADFRVFFRVAKLIGKKYMCVFSFL